MGTCISGNEWCILGRGSEGSVSGRLPEHLQERVSLSSECASYRMPAATARLFPVQSALRPLPHPVPHCLPPGASPCPHPSLPVPAPSPCSLLSTCSLLLPCFLAMSCTLSLFPAPSAHPHWLGGGATVSPRAKSHRKKHVEKCSAQPPLHASLPKSHPCVQRPRRDTCRSERGQEHEAMNLAAFPGDPLYAIGSSCTVALDPGFYSATVS